MDFAKAFEALTGNGPLRWQKRLFECLDSDKIPSVCDLPTGLGKTSVIPIWMIALARQARESRSRINLPRRLIYIVNRRTVVDQSTTLVERIRKRLLNPSDAAWSKHEEMLCSLASALGCLSPDDSPLAVSTLRGELADNEEWRNDPARAAIVIGTVDMIGSKLLFSGYGDRLYKRAHHAGLIGQDVLIVHDEAHLTPAFSDLLHSVETTQKKDPQKKDYEPKPVRVMELSATRRDSSGNDDVFPWKEEDEQDEFVKDRLDAKKKLHLHKLEPQKSEKKLQTEKRFIQKIVDCAYRHEADTQKVLIYVRQPEIAQEVNKGLRRKLGNEDDDRVALLTGTIRGYERDQLVTSNQVYKELLNAQSQPAKTVYLVSTSAGEVGIDIDADHMVCDLMTLDSMIQRLGRVNRRGGADRDACIDVVYTEKDENLGGNASDIDKAISATLNILKSWEKDNAPGCSIDVSPRNLKETLSQDKRKEAFSPMPETRPLTDILLDAWSLTSVDTMPGRPAVATYLHGLTHDPPETYVVWRQEIAFFKKYDIDERSLLGRWFNVCGIRTEEQLRDRTSRIKNRLGALLKRHARNKIGCDFPVVLLDERGEAKLLNLSEVIKNDFDLQYKTIVLPVEVGGLGQDGIIDSTIVEPVLDVAEVATGKIQRKRWLHTQTVDSSLYQRLGYAETLESLPQGLQERERIMLKEPVEGAEGTEERIDLLLCMPEKQSPIGDPETAKVRQTLAEHTEAITKHMDSISDRLGLGSPIKAALVAAAKMHDRGKDRVVWQRYADNDNGAEALAKSTKYRHWRVLGGYRHEFGSLLEAMDSEYLRNCSERDLILHLIAAHHGHARPHFAPKAFDHERFTTRSNEDATAGTMRRFGQLQHRFGRWGLAWLESLLRCADIAASKATQNHSPED